MKLRNVLTDDQLYTTIQLKTELDKHFDKQSINNHCQMTNIVTHF